MLDMVEMDWNTCLFSLTFLSRMAHQSTTIAETSTPINKQRISINNKKVSRFRPVQLVVSITGAERSKINAAAPLSFRVVNYDVAILCPT